MHHVARLALPFIVASALATPAVGQDGPQAESKPVPPNLVDLLDRIERLEGDKVQMQDEIAELRAQNGDTWLTEERAEQVRLLVEDVLTDADTRSSLLQDGATAGWDGKFFLASADGRFRLNVGGQLQMRWNWNYHDKDPKQVYGFENTRTKLVFSGHVFSRDLTYKIQGDFGAQPGGAGTSVLQDAWVRWMLNSDWSLRFGQFKLPYNREFLVDSMYQQVVERSLVSERGHLGRSPGIELTHGGRNTTFSIALSNGGEFNVAPGLAIPGVVANVPLLIGSSSTLNIDYAVTARYQHKFAGTWDQFRQLTSPPGEAFALLWGIAGHYQRNDPHSTGTARDHSTWVAATTDVSAQWGGANLFASLIWNYFDIPSFNTNTVGATLQGGLYFTEKLEGYARVEWGRFIINGDPFQKDMAVVTVGGNYYLDGQDIKLSADVGFGLNPVSTFWNSDIAMWRVDQPDVKPQIVVRTQFQLLF
jgi:hypothetical protein